MNTFRSDAPAELKALLKVGPGFGCVMRGGARDVPAEALSGRERRAAVTAPAPGEGMTQPKPYSSLPHHKLIAYQVALQLVTLIGRTRISDARLREQARKSAASAALNVAEGAARQSRADKSRVYGIALAEACEACAAVEIAGEVGACSASDVQAVLALGIRVKNILSRLIR